MISDVNFPPTFLGEPWLSSRLEDVREVPLRNFQDGRGTLSLLGDICDETGVRADRCFFLADVAPGQSRGDHANTRTDEAIVVACGQVEIVADDGFDSRSFRLGALTSSLTVPRGIWVSLRNFSPGAVCVVLASGTYAENHHITDYDKFVEAKCRATT